MAATTLKSGLDEVERDDDKRLPFLLTKVEVKPLGIADIGFLLDGQQLVQGAIWALLTEENAAYDLFIINQIATMLQYSLYDGHSLPANLEAGANIGAVVIQLGFGYLADGLGRKAVYGKELIIIIVAAILTLATPTGKLSPDDCLIYLGATRIFLCIGIGGDYPMASPIMTNRAVIRKRSALLSYIFSNQRWGSLVGSVVTMLHEARARPAPSIGQNYANLYPGTPTAASVAFLWPSTSSTAHETGAHTAAVFAASACSFACALIVPALTLLAVRMLDALARTLTGRSFVPCGAPPCWTLETAAGVAAGL
ncbi:hypothetical protein AURDEDRAFT_169310 [Auricularia subglabra TFB-10046 SS5]|nr:hypothetical protein AURDEDRAFT_169310 [Auricularia subglabra TFB-10046 SS5]